MALKQPTKISAWEMMTLIGLLVVSPTQFQAREAIDNASLEHQPNDQRSRAEMLRRIVMLTEPYRVRI